MDFGGTVVRLLKRDHVDLFFLFTFLLSFSYEFTVKPKNELGSGPTSDPVSFSTESGQYQDTNTHTHTNKMSQGAGLEGQNDNT